ncbi:dsRBD fold-containing protein [Sphaerisporangium sp. B11E5]|uniref:dsRBD fold-containing protein n=1 Tax=Sphaerisporangium sp. B11E5 TaxID=3153563 RepID=UPI00325C5247
MQAKEWVVEIHITEDDNDDRTVARAVLLTETGQRHESLGHARRNPVDHPVPEIGDELAAARALADLSAKLSGDAAEDVAHMAGHPT